MICGRTYLSLVRMPYLAYLRNPRELIDWSRILDQLRSRRST
jgi:hypothetical protein